MLTIKKDIIDQLQKEILSLQGFKPPAPGMAVDLGLKDIETAFPNNRFPTGAVHEMVTYNTEQVAATGGFLAGILGGLMQQGGVCFWISSSRTLFPPALKAFGVQPERVIFIDLQREKDVLWAMEEALKCEGLAAVVGEMREIDFTASRRLQLSVEQSRVTGFILRHRPRNSNTIACVSRWKISSCASEAEENMPGVGFPRWKVELLKIRNGMPGDWVVEWFADRFHVLPSSGKIKLIEENKKSGTYA